MTEAFVRQRRNLFLSSVLLLTLCVGDVQLTELTFAGITFDAFKHPGVFLAGAWIAFFYFTYRYTVYFLEESRKELARLWIRELEASVNPRVEQLVRARYDTPNAGCGFSYATLRNGGFIYHGQAMFPSPEYNNEKRLNNFQFKVSEWALVPWQAMGIAKFSFLTPALSEHVLPLLLAAAALIHCGFIVNWAGSFSALAA